MAHKYKVFEINQDGSVYDTGKVIDGISPTITSYGTISDNGTIMTELMNLYGFNNFVGPYHHISRSSRNNKEAERDCFYVYGTCYQGNRDLWYLKRNV